MRDPSMFVRHAALAVAVTFFVLLLRSAHAPPTLVAKIERVSEGDMMSISKNQDEAPLRN
jgi:hypothetical protein